MESSKIKLMLKILFGQSNQGRFRITKEDTFILILKNGKIRQAGGILLSKVIKKLTLKKLIHSPPNYQILTERQDPQFKK